MLDTPVNQFRTALHGFNREDVVGYIDGMTAKYQSQLRSLQDENSQLRSALEQAQSVSDASAQNDQALEEANARLQQSLAENTALRQQLQDLEQRLREARVSAVVAPPAPAAPAAPLYAAEPQRDYSEMELAAYRRAEVMERLARDRSQTVYRQVQSVFANGASKLEIGQNDLEQLAKTLEADARQLMQLLAKLRGAYNETSESFRAVGDQSIQYAESL